MEALVAVVVLLCCAGLKASAELDTLSYVALRITSVHKLSVVQNQFTTQAVLSGADFGKTVRFFIFEPAVLSRIGRPRLNVTSTPRPEVQLGIFAREFDSYVEPYLAQLLNGSVVARFSTDAGLQTQVQLECSAEVRSNTTKFRVVVTVFYERRDYVWFVLNSNGFDDDDKIDGVGLRQQLHVVDPFSIRATPLYDIGGAKNWIFAPSNPDKFTEQFRRSHLITCPIENARRYNFTYGADSESTIEAKMEMRAMIASVKFVMDELRIPFWIGSGTLLGWFRQCDFLGHTTDVDIGVFIKDYKTSFIAAMVASGFTLTHKFGTVADSFELSFRLDTIKLDVFFFYEDNEGDVYWNGGTQARTGRKFRYNFPKFNLCWSTLRSVKIRIPCDTKGYIMANYGETWAEKVEEWDWKASPPNVVDNGVWPQKLWPLVIQCSQNCPFPLTYP